MSDALATQQAFTEEKLEENLDHIKLGQQSTTEMYKVHLGAQMIRAFKITYQK